MPQWDAVFVVRCSPPLGTEFLPLDQDERTATRGLGTPPLINLPSRFHESHSSGVPFDICIENVLKDLAGEGAS